MMTGILEQPANGPTLRPRHAHWAIVLSVVIGMGAGQLYNARPRRALFAAGFVLFALALIPASASIPPDSGQGRWLGLALAALSLLVLVGVIADAAIGSVRIKAVPQARLYPRYAYALLLLASLTAYGLTSYAGNMLIKRAMYRIEGAGMAPALHQGDYIFGYRGYYDDHPVRRGDIVLFQGPGRQLAPGGQRPETLVYIKRIVGLPGETVQVLGGVLHIDGAPVDRRQVTPREMRHPRTGKTVLAPQYTETLPGGLSHRIIEIDGDRGVLDDTPSTRVPKGHVFVMGDSRDNSRDSRWIGPVPIRNLTDRAEIVFWSADPDRVGLRLAGE